MERHVDVHRRDYPPQLPVLGEVTAIYPKDHPQNPTGKITLYQVKGLLQEPAMPVTIGNNVPYAGQSAGFDHEKESPLVVGQRVIVLFLEGDPQRPVILDTFPYVGPKSTPVAAQTNDEAPQERAIANGVDVVTTKDGDTTLTLAEDRSLTVKDSSGSVVIKLLKSGGGDYVVYLGGDSSLQRLIDERAAAIFNGHVHHYLGDSGIPQVSGPPADDATTPGIVTTTPTAITSDHMTALTKAK